MNALKKHWNWLKWVVAVGVIGFLFYRYREQFSQLSEREISYGFLFVALGLCGASIVLTFVRWYILVWAQDFPFKLSDAMRLGFIGYLFNYVGPGGAGGDLVKAVMIAREQSSRKAVAVATVLLDRIIGMLGLFIVGAAASLFLRNLWSHTEVQIIVAVLAGGSVVGCAAIALMLHEGFSRWRIVQALTRIPVVGRFLAEIIQGVVLYQRRPRVVWLAVGISLIGHFGMLSSFYFCALALQSGPAAPTYWEHLMLIPGAELAAVFVPLPGGVGALEAAIVYVYQLVNEVNGMPVAAAAAEAAGLFTAIAFRVVSICVAAIGAGYYLTARKQIDEALHEQDAADHPADPSSEIECSAMSA